MMTELAPQKDDLAVQKSIEKVRALEDEFQKQEAKQVSVESNEYTLYTSYHQLRDSSNYLIGTLLPLSDMDEGLLPHEDVITLMVRVREAVSSVNLNDSNQHKTVSLRLDFIRTTLQHVPDVFLLGWLRTRISALGTDLPQ